MKLNRNKNKLIVVVLSTIPLFLSSCDGSSNNTTPSPNLSKTPQQLLGMKDELGRTYIKALKYDNTKISDVWMGNSGFDGRAYSSNVSIINENKSGADMVLIGCEKLQGSDNTDFSGLKSSVTPMDVMVYKNSGYDSKFQWYADQHNGYVPSPLSEQTSSSHIKLGSNDYYNENKSQCYYAIVNKNTAEPMYVKMIVDTQLVNTYNPDPFGVYPTWEPAPKVDLKNLSNVTKGDANFQKLIPYKTSLNGEITALETEEYSEYLKKLLNVWDEIPINEQILLKMASLKPEFEKAISFYNELAAKYQLYVITRQQEQINKLLADKRLSDLRKILEIKQDLSNEDLLKNGYISTKQGKLVMANREATNIFENPDLGEVLLNSEELEDTMKSKAFQKPEYRKYLNTSQDNLRLLSEDPGLPLPLREAASNSLVKYNEVAIEELDNGELSARKVAEYSLSPSSVDDKILSTTRKSVALAEEEGVRATEVIAERGLSTGAKAAIGVGGTVLGGVIGFGIEQVITSSILNNVTASQEEPAENERASGIKWDVVSQADATRWNASHTDNQILANAQKNDLMKNSVSAAYRFTYLPNSSNIKNSQIGYNLQMDALTTPFLRMDPDEKIDPILGKISSDTPDSVLKLTLSPLSSAGDDEYAYQQLTDGVLNEMGLGAFTAIYSPAPVINSTKMYAYDSNLSLNKSLLSSNQVLSKSGVALTQIGDIQALFVAPNSVIKLNFTVPKISSGLGAGEDIAAKKLVAKYTSTDDNQLDSGFFTGVEDDKLFNSFASDKDNGGAMLSAFDCSYPYKLGSSCNLTMRITDNTDQGKTHGKILLQDVAGDFTSIPVYVGYNLVQEPKLIQGRAGSSQKGTINLANVGVTDYKSLMISGLPSGLQILGDSTCGAYNLSDGVLSINTPLKAQTQCKLVFSFSSLDSGDSNIQIKGIRSTGSEVGTADIENAVIQVSDPY